MLKQVKILRMFVQHNDNWCLQNAASGVENVLEAASAM